MGMVLSVKHEPKRPERLGGGGEVGSGAAGVAMTGAGERRGFAIPSSR